jgi:8-oxo-dGTP pyrophosphatase MutT (NUDIX family)
MYRACHRGPAGARILLQGKGPLERVQLEESGLAWSLTREQEALCERACEKLRQQGQEVFSGPVYRLLDWCCGPFLSLRVSRGNYAQVIGTKAHPEWGCPSRVLAVCCVLETPGGFLVERRSLRVAALPGRWHVAPAGSIGVGMSPLQALLQEAHEELGLAADELDPPLCLGLIYAEDSGVHQLVCAARTGVDSADFLLRPRSGCWESDGYEMAPIDPQGLGSWLEQHRSQLTPAAVSALWLEGGRRWGSDWFESYCCEL